MLGKIAFIRSKLPTAAAIPSKRGDTRSKFSPPLTFNVEIFPFLLEKNAIFSNNYWRDGGYVIQLKCPNYFWPGLSERDMRGISLCR